MLSIREAVQMYNSLASEKINIAKPENVLKIKLQGAIEEASPSFRDSLPSDIIEVFNFLTGINPDEKEELKTSDSTFVPEFKGIWKEVKETLYNTGMSKEVYDNLPLTFRSQEVFHMKKKGLVLVKENGTAKLVKSDQPVVIRHKSANGAKLQEKATKIDYSNLSLQDQISILNSQIQDLESKKSFLELQVIEKTFNEMFLKSQSEKELTQAIKDSGLEEIDFSQPMAFAAA